MSSICNEKKLYKKEKVGDSYILYFFINEIVAIKFLESNCKINYNYRDKIKKGEIIVSGTNQLTVDFNCIVVEIATDQGLQYDLIIKKTS